MIIYVAETRGNMKEILSILSSSYTITRENYKKLKKIMLIEMVEEEIIKDFYLINYIMIKDFESEYDRRDFIQKVFKCKKVSDNTKLKIYLKILSLGVESCFINPNRQYDESCTS